MMNRQERIMAVLEDKLSADDLSDDDIAFLEDCVMECIISKISESGRSFIVEPSSITIQ